MTSTVAETARVLGIRHHGPGSSRSLIAALDEYAPDALLIEGPPDADALCVHAANEALAPPVALLVHVVDDPRRASFYPFASYSPEWVALRWAAQRNVPARFADLPCAHAFALETDDGDGEARRVDPLDELARAAGAEDGEEYWDRLVEGRAHDSPAVFDAVLELMRELRAHVGDTSPANARREAWMRRELRAELRAGRERVAFVCGAWHAPAVAEHARRGSAGEDDALLKGLPKVKTAAAWAPWTFERLARESGYGAGIDSPEWYQLVWDLGGRSTAHAHATAWLTRTARLLRERDIDTSTAAVVEAVRLADALAALRGRELPGLGELQESALCVLCAGNDVPMRIVRRELVVGRRLGTVPDDAPMLPLQRDLAAEQKRQRLAVSAVEKDVELDLRKELDLERSRLLRRLAALDVPWGTAVSSRSRGTFRETWRLVWKPEFVVALVEGARFGNTVLDAADAKLARAADAAPTIAAIASHLDDALLAELPRAARALLDALDARSVAAGDAFELMDALPPLTELARYGNVRDTDAGAIRVILERIAARIFAGLATACASLDDEAANAASARIAAVDGALVLVQDETLLAAWRDALERLAASESLHALVLGRITRLSFAGAVIDRGEVERRIGLALSVGTEPVRAAAFVEGFLAGSGAVLVHDREMLALVDAWLTALPAQRFDDVLPLLRRTFATFEPGEVRRLSDLVSQPALASSVTTTTDGAFDETRARKALARLAHILGAKP